MGKKRFKARPAFGAEYCDTSHLKATFDAGLKEQTKTKENLDDADGAAVEAAGAGNPPGQEEEQVRAMLSRLNENVERRVAGVENTAGVKARDAELQELAQKRLALEEKRVIQQQANHEEVIDMLNKIHAAIVSNSRQKAQHEEQMDMLSKIHAAIVSNSQRKP